MDFVKRIWCVGTIFFIEACIWPSLSLSAAIRSASRVRALRARSSASACSRRKKRSAQSIRQQLLADEQGLLDKTFLHALGLSTKLQVSCHDLELRLFTALAHILSASRILGLVRSSIGLPHPTEHRGSKHAPSGGLSQTPDECDDLASMFTPRMRRVLFTEPSGAALPSGSTDSSNVTAE